MLKTILTSLRSADLRKKLAFTAFILLVYRFGSYVPVPGIDLEALQNAIDQRGSRLLDFLNYLADCRSDHQSVEIRFAQAPVGW